MEDSLKSLVTRSFKEAVKLIMPAIRVSPIRALRGTDSPVRADVSRLDWPAIDLSVERHFLTGPDQNDLTDL